MKTKGLIVLWCSDCSGRFLPTGKHAGELTCLAWGKVPASVTASATKKKKAKQMHDVVALGNAVGGVMIYDCSRGELRQTFGGEGSGHTGKVHDLALNAAGPRHCAQHPLMLHNLNNSSRITNKRVNTLLQAHFCIRARLTAR